MWAVAARAERRPVTISSSGAVVSTIRSGSLTTGSRGSKATDTAGNILLTLKLTVHRVDTDTQ
jgi:hypothetical protein